MSTLPLVCFISLSPLNYAQTTPQLQPATLVNRINCDERGTVFCLDRQSRQNYEGEYIGHDEPSVIFYSNVPGSGNNATFTLVLPKDPPIKPNQFGTGGTFNFQLHPAFWFGMALCDTQSAPNPNVNGTCVPNSDTNAMNNASPLSPNYIGKHPGTAFLELQFYPPGWIATPGLIASNVYFAAMNIDSFSFNTNTGTNNNQDCLEQVGQEPVNFAILTKNGVPLNPPNPLGLSFGTSNPDLNNVLVMLPGDTLKITIQDTPNGLITQVQDLTLGVSGFMVASANNGFGQVDFNPTATTCTVTPYTFDPMYSTASEDTRVPWAVHSYNIAFSDEIGHFEFCNAFDGNPNSPTFLNCTSAGVNESDSKTDDDDAPCANPAFFGLPSSFIPITGCVGEDLDVDGVSYGNNWPGTGSAAKPDALYAPTPIQFTSPKFHPKYISPTTQYLNYDRVALEVDIPGFEINCDPHSGNGCSNPPAGAQFYPIYSITESTSRQCWWQFGGPNLPGTLNNFGGTAAAEYGSLYPTVYAGTHGPVIEMLNYRQPMLNPCPVINP